MFDYFPRVGSKLQYLLRMELQGWQQFVDYTMESSSVAMLAYISFPDEH